jgi:hypothetical protein
MTTFDDAFIAYGGGQIGVFATSTILPFNVGVFGIGRPRGVFGLLADGSPQPYAATPVEASYGERTGVLGASNLDTGVAGVSNRVGVFGQCGEPAGLPGGMRCGVLGASDANVGVFGWSTANAAISGTSVAGTGVAGASTNGFGMVGDSTNDVGVRGWSTNWIGIIGHTGAPMSIQLFNPHRPSSPQRSALAGVIGSAIDAVGAGGVSERSIGVIGQSGTPPTFDPGMNYVAGVVGTSRDASGVIGVSQNTAGVLGTTSGNPPRKFRSPPPFLGGVTGISGTRGPLAPGLTNISGVLGTSDQNVGVLGTSNFVGVFGYCGTATGVGVVGQAVNVNSFAGYFAGKVEITGALTVGGNVVVPASVTAMFKNAVVPFPDGTQRLLHCMESPEHWFEDFGVAKLKGGRAVVKLDTDFAKTIKPGDYRVFLTPEGDCRGLYVRSKSAKGFEVRELQGGESSVAFSYRIVGRRKDIKAHKRFARIDARLPLPRAARTPRKSKPTAAAFRTFVAGLEREARKRTPKGARKTGRSRAPAKRWTSRAARPTAKK